MKVDPIKEAEVLTELLDALVEQVQMHAIPSTQCKERPAYERAISLIARLKAGATVACPHCTGAGDVDDGYLYCSEGGIPYENGPIKCKKQCPACNGSGVQR